MKIRSLWETRGIRYLAYFIVMIAFWMTLLCAPMIAQGKQKPPERSKFYDFSEQLIDGEIRKPTALYTDARAKAKFDRLLKLKRSFMRELIDTAKEKVFK